MLAAAERMIRRNINQALFSSLRSRLEIGPMRLREGKGEEIPMQCGYRSHFASPSNDFVGKIIPFSSRTFGVCYVHGLMHKREVWPGTRAAY